jgi:type IV secretory pathway VirB10-like protein
VSLGEAAGMDAAGSMGVGGEVRMRWGELLAAAALVTVFDVAQRGAVGDGGASFPREAAAAAGRNVGDLGEDVTERVLRWEPEILIRAGTQIRIAPARTVRVC